MEIRRYRERREIWELKYQTGREDGIKYNFFFRIVL